MYSHISSTIKDSNNPNSHLFREGGRERRLIRPSKKCKPSTVLALELLPGFERLCVIGTPGPFNGSAARREWMVHPKAAKNIASLERDAETQVCGISCFLPFYFLDLKRH